MLGRALEPSQTRVDDGGGDGTFRGIMLGSLGFLGPKEYIGERAASGGNRGGHARGGRHPLLGRALGWCGCLVAPLRLPFWLLESFDEIFAHVDFRPIPRIFCD